MFGQLSEQVLILEDVGVWVEGGEGVEEEGGELSGHPGSCSLLSEAFSIGHFTLKR